MLCFFFFLFLQLVSNLGFNFSDNFLSSGQDTAIWYWAGESNQKTMNMNIESESIQRFDPNQTLTKTKSQSEITKYRMMFFPSKKV